MVKNYENSACKQCCSQYIDQRTLFIFVERPMALILASASPRRRELLGYYPLDITVMKPFADETPPAGLPPFRCAEEIARRKADAVTATAGDMVPVLAADTIVVINGEILGKPIHESDARRMLRKLSGRTHAVITGVALFYKGTKQVFSVSTEVDFKVLTEKEIDDYVKSGEPSDKAGAYAIQGIGGFMITAIRGSYSNVVGLPVAEVVAALQEIGVLDGISPL